MITINNEKAIEIVKQKIRAVRDPKLAALDIEFQKALELGSDTSDIVARKNELRDMTKLAEGKTVEELYVLLEEITNA